jgi:hypothetical protein
MADGGASQDETLLRNVTIPLSYKENRDIAEALQLLAEIKDCSLSEILRVAAREYLEAHKRDPEVKRRVAALKERRRQSYLLLGA